jgi:DNA polymerase-3 subunit gamma/tau
MHDGSLFDVQDYDGPAPASERSPAVGTHSLYRKYRPTSFAEDDLVGQEHVVGTLRNAIALDRISHAYLFCGPRGTGKTTTARLLAKAVNCLDPDPGRRPCNRCAACDAINRNATTDVIEIDAASNRGIDDIRDLRERVKYAPTQLKTKFYIIDEAHQITGAAANAFLKTLEEPPAHTRFVLATTDPEELLPTIVSRCQRFDFRRIHVDAMIATLRRVAEREGIRIEDDALPVIARQATGSLRDALGMLDQVAMYRESADAEDKAIDADTVRAVLGVSRNERVERLARALADRDPAGGLREINSAVEAGDDIRQLGRQLLSYLRMLMLQLAGGATDADETAMDLAQRFSLDELAELIRPMADLDFRARRASIPQVPLEIAIVTGAGRVSHPAVTNREPALDAPVMPVTPPREPEQPAVETGPRVSLRDRVRGTPATATPPPAPMPADRDSRPRAETSDAPDAGATAAPAGDSPGASPGALSLERVVDLWPRIRADVKALNRRIEALLQQVDPAAVIGNKLVLVSPYEFHRNRVNSDDVRQVIEDVVGRLANGKIQVTCVSREEAQTMRGSGTGSDTAAGAGGPDPPGKGAGGTSSERSAQVDPPGDTPEVDAVSSAASLPESPPTEADIMARVSAARNIFDAEDVSE